MLCIMVVLESYTVLLAAYCIECRLVLRFTKTFGRFGTQTEFDPFTRFTSMGCIPAKAFLNDTPCDGSGLCDFVSILYPLAGCVFNTNLLSFHWNASTLVSLTSQSHSGVEVVSEVDRDACKS